MRARPIAAVVLALVALTACSGSAGFEDDDPQAHSACSEFLVKPHMKGISADDEFVVVFGMGMVVGEHASKAEAPEVQAAAKPLEGLDQWLLDEDVLIAACTDAGYAVGDDSLAAHYLAQQ